MHGNQIEYIPRNRKFMGAHGIHHELQDWDFEEAYENNNTGFTQTHFLISRLFIAIREDETLIKYQKVRKTAYNLSLNWTPYETFEYVYRRKY